jgi:hypothetical protein
MSRESTEQGRSGRQGAQASQAPGAGGQPRQGSNRTEVYGAGEQETQHQFAPGHAPSEQGEQGSPSPEKIREHQQGLAGSGTGHRGAGVADTDVSEETATSGAPRGGETRHGRHHSDRPRE